MTAILLNIGQKLKGRVGLYTISKQLQETVWLATNQKEESVIVKCARHWRIHNERDILLKYQGKTSCMRPFIDETEEPADPPAIVLKYLQNDVLNASNTRRLTRPQIKHVARSVLEALSLLHIDGLVHTDIKPSNVLLNYGPGECSFSDVRLADFESTVSKDSPYATGSAPIGTSIFRSPEAQLQLGWDTATDIWSFGTMLISLLYGEGFHIFSPGVPVGHDGYEIHVLLKQYRCFGPLPASYREIEDEFKLNILGWVIQNSPVETLKPFHRTTTKEICKEDKEFVLKAMKLDPRERPTAQRLLNDDWLHQD